VFSHDAPQQAAENIFTHKNPDATNTSKLLQEMFEAHQPKVWVFGHWHASVDTKFGDTTFRCLDELGTMTLEFMNHHEETQ
jgi:Icc-related predicted phosphoesterase